MNSINISRIDLNLFPVFEAIYREGSISRAARHLHLTQPAVSHAINRLRRSLDDELFTRSRQGVRPTPLARQLIGPVRQALSHLQQGIQASSEFRASALQRTFRLGLRDLLEAQLLPELVARCQAEAPEVRFRCISADRESLRRLIAAGEIDLAADAWIGHDAAVFHETLLTDTLCCLLGRNHPALKQEWGTETLLEWPHVQVSSRDSGSGLEDAILARHGHRRRIDVRTPHYLAAATIVARSQLILCLPSSFARQLAELLNLERRPFPLHGGEIENYLYWSREAHGDPAIQWLRSRLLQCLSRSGDP